MFTKLKQKEIVKLMISTLLIIQFFSVISFGESNISQEISRFSNKENLSISDFKEFAKEQEYKGYKLYILDVQEGFTLPKLITDENINKVKDIVNKQSNISRDIVNESTYPELFRQYDVEFLKCKDNREFIFFIESNLVNLVVKQSSDNIEVSVDGKSPIKLSGEGIPLKKGHIYNITVYKDGNEKLSKEVNLTNYKKDVYELNVGSNIIPIMVVVIGVMLVLISIVVVKKIKDKQQQPNSEQENDKGDNIQIQELPRSISNPVIIGESVYEYKELLEHEGYEDILQVQAINKLETHLNTTKSRLNLVTNKNFDILSNAYNSDISFISEINKIKDHSYEINLALDQIQRDIDNLKHSIRNIKKEPEEKKINKIKLSIEIAKDIYLRLEDCYLGLEEIKSEQYLIKEAISISTGQPGGSIYTNQSYIDIVNNNAKVLDELVKHVIRRDNQMDDFKSFIENEMKNMSKSIDNVYLKMENEVSRICQSVKDNNTSMNNALNNFDANIINTLNLKINYINKQLESINKNPFEINKGINTLEQSLISEFNKTIKTKLDILEEIVPTLIDKVNSEYKHNNEYDLCNEYEDKLDEVSLGYLRTAEYLYRMSTNSRSMKLYVYSSIYIMYSKLLEAELAKCINKSYLRNPMNRTLGNMVGWLSKHKSKTWENFLDVLKENDIKLLRNHAAHNEISGNGIIEIKHVGQIRDFLFDKSQANNTCWLEFIINEQRQKIGGTN